jgi:mRNA-degrading endonuclease RelE of RelBE toxin-antitoxin system
MNGNEGLFLLLFFGGITAFCFIVLAIWEIINLIDNRVEKKRQKEHPLLFEMIDELDNAYCGIERYYDKEVAPRKEKIDFITEGLTYLPKAEREKRERNIETLKEEIYHHACIVKEMRNESKKIEGKIHAYVIANDIKWAIKEGW